MEPSIRQQLHAACDRAEYARAHLNEMEARYSDARHEVNHLINKLAPLDHPDGHTVEVPRSLNKITLIKMVREATQQDRGRVDGEGCMSLKDAKDLVEKYIAEGGL